MPLIRRYRECRIQSTATGEITSRFIDELTEIPPSSYEDVNTFLETVTGLGPDDWDFLNRSFEDINEYIYPLLHMISRMNLKQKRFKEATH